MRFVNREKEVARLQLVEGRFAVVHYHPRTTQNRQINANWKSAWK